MLKYIVAAAVAVSFAAIASEASAQKVSPKREAAMKVCVEKVAAVVGMDPDKQSQRIAAWKACMTAQGERP